MALTSHRGKTQLYHLKNCGLCLSLLIYKMLMTPARGHYVLLYGLDSQPASQLKQ